MGRRGKLGVPRQSLSDPPPLHGHGESRKAVKGKSRSGTQAMELEVILAERCCLRTAGADSGLGVLKCSLSCIAIPSLVHQISGDQIDPPAHWTLDLEGWSSRGPLDPRRWELLLAAKRVVIALIELPGGRCASLRRRRLIACLSYPPFSTRPAPL